MEFQEILTTIAKLVLIAIGVAVVMLIPKAKAWAEEKIGAQKLAKIIEYVTIFVAAADQILKTQDPTGAKRKAYVIDRLLAKNIEVTPEVDAIIEAKVLALEGKTAEPIAEVKKEEVKKPATKKAAPKTK